MNEHDVVKISILAFFIAAVLAYSIMAVAANLVEYPTETSVVGRIVGDSPAELNHQLAIDNMDLKHATYVPAEPRYFFDPIRNDKGTVIAAQFPGHHNEIVPYSDYDIETGVKNFKPQEYFVLERNDGTISGKPLALEDAKKWQPYFQNNNPLFLFNFNFGHGGLYLPKENSFTSILGQDAVIVTTNSGYSEEFTKSFICNLALYKTVGEVFKEARNAYYLGAHNSKFLFFRTNSESIGTTLYSYLLYGNPLATVSVPQKGEVRLRDYCRQYIPDINIKTQFMSQSFDGTNSVANEPSFEVMNQRIEQEDKYAFISADNLEQSYSPFKLVLPHGTLKYDFPLKTVIKGIKLVSLDDPIDLSVPNLPSWSNGLVDRICAENTKPAGIEFSHTFTEDKEIVLIQVNPVEVVDCEKGLFRLYRKITYDIDFIPYSDVIIRSVNSPASGAPGSEATAEVELQNIKEKQTSGKLVVSSGKDILAAHIVELSQGETKSFGLAFSLPSTEGTHAFELEYLDGEEALTGRKFAVDVYSLKLSVNAPSKVGIGEDAEIKIAVMSNEKDAVICTGNPCIFQAEAAEEPGKNAYSATYSLLKGGSAIVTGSFEGVKLSPGENVLPVKLKTEVLEPGSYAFEAKISSDNYMKTASAEFFVAKLEEEAPQLADMQDLKVPQGAIARLNPSALDLNGDYVTYSLSEPFNRFGKWQTGKHHKGKYDVEIVASDGKLEDKKTVTVIVAPEGFIDSFADNGKEKEFTFSKAREEKTTEIKLLKKAKVTEATITLEAEQP